MSKCIACNGTMGIETLVTQENGDDYCLYCDSVIRDFLKNHPEYVQCQLCKVPIQPTYMFCRNCGIAKQEEARQAMQQLEGEERSELMDAILKARALIGMLHLRTDRQTEGIYWFLMCRRFSEECTKAEQFFVEKIGTGLYLHEYTMKSSEITFLLTPLNRIEQCMFPKPAAIRLQLKCIGALAVMYARDIEKNKSNADIWVQHFESLFRTERKVIMGFVQKWYLACGRKQFQDI